MLERLKDLPPGVYGVRARGKVTKQDYDVLEPLLDTVRESGGDVRFLYHFGDDFEGFTAGAAWEDVRIGWQHLRLFKRCAVVSDHGWIRQSGQLIGTLMPCPVRVYDDAALDEAIQWLASPLEASNVSHRLIPEAAVVVLEVTGPLRAEDFDALALTVDPFVEAHGKLNGIVVHVEKFPGWQDFGSILRHLRFVREHHRVISRVALAADGVIAEHGPAFAEHFVAAEIRHFEHGALDDAIAWASEPA